MINEMTITTNVKYPTSWREGQVTLRSSLTMSIIHAGRRIEPRDRVWLDCDDAVATAAGFLGLRAPPCPCFCCRRSARACARRASRPIFVVPTGLESSVAKLLGSGIISANPDMLEQRLLCLAALSKDLDRSSFRAVFP